MAPESPAMLSSFCSCVSMEFPRRCKRLSPSVALLESQAHTFMYSLTNVSSLCQSGHVTIFFL